MEENKKFYQKGWFTILLLIFIWPVGLIVMWVNKVFSKKVRIIITAVCAVIMLFALAGGSQNSDNPAPSENTTVIASEESTEPQTEAQAQPATEAATQPVTQATTQPAAQATTQPVTQATTQPATQATTQPAAQPKENVTMGMKNALSSAKTYLKFSAFSYQGLINQLKFEQFSDEEAKYAADNCGADWNEQAAKSAKKYLEFSSFSRQGLIDQLMFEGFTQQQAEYGASAAGY